MKIKGFIQSLVLAGVLAAGFAAVWGVVAVWALEVGAAASTGVRSGRLALLFPFSAALVFLSDGTPVVSYERLEQQSHLRDLQGNPVEEPDGEHPFLTLASLPAKSSIEERIDWEDRVHRFADGRVPSGYWYFIADGRREGSGYFVGYDSESRTCLGYLGRRGLREGPLPLEEHIPITGIAPGKRELLLCSQQLQILLGHPRYHYAGRAPRGSVSTWDVYVLGRDGKLYHADLQKRTLHVAFDRSPVLSASLTAGQPDAIHGTPYRPTVRTESAISVLDERGDVLKSYPIPESLRGQKITFAEAGSGEAVMHTSSTDDMFASEIEHGIFRVDAAGRYQQAAITLPWFGWKRLVPLAGLVIPSPIGLAGTVAYLRPSMLVEDDLAASYPEALGQALTEFWPALAVSQLMALGFAVLCYRRQVRYGANRRARLVWTLFVLLLGLPGWIGYRFCRSWPVLESCPKCDSTVPRDRESCLCCTDDFPRPALKGTEVFA